VKKPLINSHVLACALIVLVTVGIYCNSLQGDFIWDDRGLITNNAEYLNDWKNLFAVFVKPFFGQTPYYRPLLTGSFIIDYQLWELNPFGYHYTNVLFHTANALLVYLFIYILFKHTYLALFTSLLFASHPVQTEAVAWISGRNDVLLTFFSLLTLILHLCWHEYKGLRRVLAYSVYLAAYACTLLTKESGLILPVLAILVDCFFTEGRRIQAKSYVGLLLISILYFFSRMRILDDIGLNLGGKDLFHTLIGVVVTYAYYFKMLLFPLSQTAVPSLTVSSTGNEFVLISSIFLIVFLLTPAVLCLKKFREVSFVIIWVFISLFPVCGIVPLSVPALEHRLYLACVCFSMLIPISVCKLQQLQSQTCQLAKIRKVLLCIIPVIVVVYSAKTIARNTIWHNEGFFWLYSVHDSPRSALARNNLGIVYSTEGAHEKAIREFKTALTFYDEKNLLTHGPKNSHHAKIYNNLGRSYYQLLHDSILDSHESVAPIADDILQCHDEEAYKLYTLSYACYQSALRFDPSSAEAHNNLGDLYYFMKQYQNAEKEYEAALKVSSEHPR